MAQLYIDIHTHQHHSPEADLFGVYNNMLNSDQDLWLFQPVTAGLHPWHIAEEDPGKGLSLLEELLQDKEIVAVGECGLDKAISIPLAIQQSIFQQQIRLAKAYRTPLIIHCVRAFEEVQYALKAEQFTGKSIFHGFNKNKTIADQLLKKGFYLSFGASILTGKHDETLASAPLDQLFLETDDVQLDIRTLYAYMAQLKKISLEELKNTVFNNYQLVFG
ncbi:TatD family hydrolase [Sphingobacterium sp. KU25419]|nr:TatD family hydrolase [Sphingobacterium sp. KU25419]